MLEFAEELARRAGETLLSYFKPLGRAEIVARNEHPDHNVDNFSRLIFLARSIRRAGAAAIDLAYVAARRIDGFWELHLAPWDVAGGAAILLAAGGRLTDFNGGSGYLSCGHVVASNKRLHEAIRGNLHPLRAL